jgi:hypothetical protein
MYGEGSTGLIRPEVAKRLRERQALHASLEAGTKGLNKKDPGADPGSWEASHFHIQLMPDF